MATPQTFTTTTQLPQLQTMQSGLLNTATAASRPQLTDDETLAGQVQKIIQSDSPFMQAAKTRANQDMNARGLLNSSMAVGAAENAAYQAALPIAQFDANAQKSVGDMQFNADQQTNLSNQSAANNMEQFNADTTNKASAANMDASMKSVLADVEANYKVLMQSNDTAKALYTSFLNNVTDINGSSTMDAAAKTSAIAAQKQMLQSGFRVIEAMNNLQGLDELLTF